MVSTNLFHAELFSAANGQYLKLDLTLNMTFGINFPTIFWNQTIEYSGLSNRI